MLPSFDGNTESHHLMSIWSYTSLEDKHEGQVYLDNKTYILLEIQLAKPLIPKRPVSVIAKR